MGMEREWKYRATAELLDKVERETAGRYADRKTVLQMETTYLDTAEGDFEKRRWTLRVRKENGNPVVTLKTPAGDNLRGEWEHPGDAPDASRLLTLGAPEELKELLQKPLIATCGARFTRRAVPMELAEGCFAELALDEGVLFRGERQTPLCEIEVEHKAGEAAATEALAKLLEARYGLQTETRSKHLRAMQL